MRVIEVARLIPGMVVGENVMSPNGQLIVAENEKLTRQSISRIKFYGIRFITIEGEDSPLPLMSSDTASLSEAEKEVLWEQKADLNTKVAESAFATALNAGAEASEAADAENASKAADAENASKAADAENASEAKAVEDATALTQAAQPSPAKKSSWQNVSPETQKYILDYATSLASMKGTFRDIADGKPINEKKLLDQTSRLFAASNATTHLFEILRNMKINSDPVFAHSMNVALISYTLGHWLKMSEEDVNVLALCGMLHDIGKTMLPQELLTKPGKYTDEEFAQMKRHPMMGFNRLKNEEIDPRIKKATLMHHERADGSGYPHNLSGKEIHPFAYIIAIADVYDAMTSNRSHRGALCPFRVIANFESEGLHKYDTRFVLTFLQNLANTYQNSRVILNDGRVGTIVMLNQAQLSKPIVQLDNKEFLDLSKEAELYIRALL